MTETAVEMPTVATDENGVPTVIVDDFGRMTYDKVKTDSVTYAALTAEIAAATGNTSAMKDSFRGTYGSDSDATDDQKKIAANIEKLASALLAEEAKRDADIDTKITALTSDSAATLAPKQEAAAKQKKSINALRTVLASTYGDDALYGLPKVSGSTSASSGNASGQQRVRNLDVFVDGALTGQKNKDGVMKSSLSAGAKAASVETSVMQQAFWTAQGTKVATDYKPEVIFTVTGTDGEHTVICRQQSAE